MSVMTLNVLTEVMCKLNNIQIHSLFNIPWFIYFVSLDYYSLMITIKLHDLDRREQAKGQTLMNVGT